MSRRTESLAERLHRLGAVPLEEVLRWVPAICDDLVRAGTVASVSLAQVWVTDDGTPTFEPVPFSGTPRDQVRHLAALAYELLKGAPPPEAPSPSDFIGLRPELTRLVHPALVGTGAPDLLAFARHLRSLGSGGTAGYDARLEVPDTKASERPPTGAGPSRVGQIFGAYELVRHLGEGGMGEVYVGRHTRLGREVAVKVLRDEYAAMPEVVQRFFQEARVVNDLRHPNVVEILDFVEEPGRVYLVMELLDGRTLAELDREQGPLDVAHLARLLAQACEALEAAHRLQVVHRDIKPENLFVTAGPPERLKVLDFGVARRAGGDAPRTQAGLVLGTPFYMAPEQAAGRPVDARADVYSLGVTLYELLSRDSMRTITTPKRLSRAASGEPIPPPLTDLVASMLALDPAHRPASAMAVRQVLMTIAEAPPPPPAPSTNEALTQAGLDRRAATVQRWVLLPVVLVLIGVAVWVFGSRPAEVAAAPAPTPAIQPPLAPVAQTKLEPAAPTPVVQQPSVAAPKIGAPPTRPAARPAPVIVKDPEPQPVIQEDPLAPFRPRLEGVQRRFTRLISKYGQDQLTSIEKANVTQALEDAAAGRHTALQASLFDAETALEDAERRLGR